MTPGNFNIYDKILISADFYSKSQQRGWVGDMWACGILIDDKVWNAETTHHNLPITLSQQTEINIDDASQSLNQL